jgi:thiamine-phosphate pyrophosphorylase
MTQQPSHPAAALPAFHPIVDVETAARHGWAPLDLARAFLDGGARLLQVRAKTLPSGPFLDLADAVVRAAAAYSAIVIINDRADVARLSGAGGVHVGQDDLPPADARALLGDSAIVGCSTHSVPQIGIALAEPVTYIAVGPVFGTRTKTTGYDAVGLDLVAQAVRAAHGRPVVAIGGITLETAPAVLAAGATSVAIISDLFVGGPRDRARAYVQGLAQFAYSRRTAEDTRG